jgi:glucose uptake protein GlcU
MGDSCEACGWAAAVLSMVAFGSFGAPIKSQKCKAVNVDPLVFQSYKTFMCFATSWLVLLTGQEFSYTPWGIVSGFFWVPGGVAMVYAIKAAGLAIGMGIGSSFIVLVSFTWGIFIFHERVESRLGASFAVLLMMMGLWGMSYYSSPSAEQHLETLDQCSVGAGASSILSDGYRGVNEQSSHNDDTSDQDEEYFQEESDVYDDDSWIAVPLPDLVIWGTKISQRKLGMASAVFNGAWGGSIMVPMKFAPADAKGRGYVISFAIGASIVTLFLWILRYSYYLSRLKSFRKAYDALPSFHLPVVWLPGALSGGMWSVGNFFSILSVEHLGEGVGYSVIQAAMLVSGLWGIFFFHEIKDTMAITKWFASAGLTISGILLLSYEHHEVQ